MQRFNIQEAPPMPQKGILRADPRPRGQDTHQQPGHVSAVGATGDGLIRSTIKAGVGALAILVFFVLPSEYGVDVTGVGRILGLTEMGEIKQQLYAEAAADDAAKAAAQSAVAADPQVGERLDAIEAQLSEIAAVLGATAAAPAQVAAAPAPTAAPAAVAPAAPVAAAPAAIPEAPAPASASEPMWRDNVSVVLAPGDGIELKMAMEEGQTARFEWSANGSVLNHDTHGDGGGQSVTYVQGRGVAGEVGELTAAFTGNHGWFWRNRTDAPVTLSLQVGGEYSRFISP